MLTAGLDRKVRMVWWVGMGLEMSGQKMVFVLTQSGVKKASY